MLKYGENHRSTKYKDKKIDNVLGHSMRTITIFAGHPSKNSILQRNREFVVSFVNYASISAVINFVGNRGSLDEKLFKQDRDLEAPEGDGTPSKRGVAKLNKISTIIPGKSVANIRARSGGPVGVHHGPAEILCL